MRLEKTLPQIKRDREKILPQIKKPDDLQSIANLIRFFWSLSNGVDDLENFTSEMEWSFFVPVGFSCVFSNWYSYVSTPPAFPLAWIHV